MFQAARLGLALARRPPSSLHAVSRLRCLSNTIPNVRSDQQMTKSSSNDRNDSNNVGSSNAVISNTDHLLEIASLSRWNRPLPSLLLMWPCWWSAGLAMGPGSIPALSSLATFAVGAFIMRGAGCTINDLIDRDIDGHVARTRSRVLASGQVSTKEAIAFLGCQLSAGLAVLLTFKPYCIVLGASSLGLVGIYPMMKRITNWPQLCLGLAFNWGALMGFASEAGACDWSVVLPLYASGVAWTIVYDTIYAHQDKADDARLGLKSTALHFGEHTKEVLTGFSAASVLGLALAGFHADSGALFYGISVAGSAAHLSWQIVCVDLNNAQDCMQKFLSNVSLGALITGGIFVDRVFLL